jgi:hypothetical protein
MKLIEKLADDEYKGFVGDNPTIAAIIVEKLAKRFYEAGFRKVRELAAREAREFAKQEREIYAAQLPPGVSAPLVLRGEALTMKLDKLGEEEV